MGMDARGGSPWSWRFTLRRNGKFTLELEKMGLDIWGKRVGAFGAMLWEGVHLDKENRLPWIPL